MIDRFLGLLLGFVFALWLVALYPALFGYVPTLGTVSGEYVKQYHGGHPWVT